MVDAHGAGGFLAVSISFFKVLILQRLKQNSPQNSGGSLQESNTTIGTSRLRHAPAAAAGSEPLAGSHLLVVHQGAASAHGIGAT